MLIFVRCVVNIIIQLVDAHVNIDTLYIESNIIHMDKGNVHLITK